MSSIQSRRACAFVVVVLVAALGSPAAQAAPIVENGIRSSFDGTPIAYTLFLPDGASASAPVPVVLITHGWGGTRTRTVGGMVQTFLGAGYAVLTWDARGFGDSGGAAMVDSQEFEVRDVQSLLDMVSGNPAILLDGPGDPRAGMFGPSYAGGIQLMTASADARLDALAPQIAWNDLPRALKPGGVLKLGWDLLLYGAGLAAAIGDGLDSPAGPQTGSYPLEIHQALAEGTALNDWSASTYAWFDARSPKHYIGGATLPDGRVLPGIHAPTLLLQGTNDTLFWLNEAIDNEALIRANGAPTKMVFYCGSLLAGTGVVHALSVAPSCAAASAGTAVTSAVLTWFDHYLEGNPVDTGAAIDYQLQDGTFASVAALPASLVSGSGGRTLVNTVAPASGSHVVPTTAIEGAHFDLPVPAGSTVLGVPHATMYVNGVGPEASLFLRILDVAPNGSTKIVDDQTTAIKVTGLSATTQTLSFDLAGVAWRVEAGHVLRVEISATSNDHSSTRTPFLINTAATVDVPVL